MLPSVSNFKRICFSFKIFYFLRVMSIPIYLKWKININHIIRHLSVSGNHGVLLCMIFHWLTGDCLRSIWEWQSLSKCLFTLNCSANINLNLKRFFCITCFQDDYLEATDSYVSGLMLFLYTSLALLSVYIIYPIQCKQLCFRMVYMLGIQALLRMVVLGILSHQAMFKIHCG